MDMLSYGEALHWLDDHGGRWCVQATRATCLVIATLGPARARAVARSLEIGDVNEALVAAVTQLQDRSGESDAS
jgi:hypothetical protein